MSTTTTAQQTTQPLDVVCALIVESGRLLIMQHGPASMHPGMWEFPGGKVDPGENPEEALHREIREELNIEVAIHASLSVSEYSYPGKSIRLIPFLCSWESGIFRLNEHAHFRWIELNELNNWDLLPADKSLLNIERNFLELTLFMVR
jgi:8-oxo-dGTP diphosphatase